MLLPSYIRAGLPNSNIHRDQAADVRERRGLDRGSGKWRICALEKGEPGLSSTEMPAWHEASLDSQVLLVNRKSKNTVWQRKHMCVAHIAAACGSSLGFLVCSK